MHRNKIRNFFKHYRVRYPEEAAVVDRISSFVDANTDCFSRELAVGNSGDSIPKSTDTPFR